MARAITETHRQPIGSNRRRALAATMAAATIAALLTACGSPSTNNTQGTPSTIVIGAGDVDTLDPAQYRSDTAYTVTANIYASLLSQQEGSEKNGVLEPTGKYVPALAQAAVWDSAKTRLTITLRPGLTFADGTPITAQDAMYSLQRSLSDVGYTAAIGIWLNIANPATDISAPAANTLVIKVTHYSPLIEKFLAFQIFPLLDAAKAKASGGAKWAATFFATNATPSGPYAVQARVQGQSITLTKNPKYTATNTADSIKTITIQNMPDPNQQYLALKNGAISVALNMEPQLASKVAGDPNLKLYNLPYSNLIYLGMNNTDPQLKDARVRQAISYLMPYDALRQSVMKGYAGPADGAVPYPMPDALDKTGKAGAYSTDATKAMALFAEAGVDPKKLRFTISVPSDQPVLQQSAVYIQSALHGAGITVNLDELTSAKYNDSLGKQQLYVASWYSWGQDSIYQLYFLLKSGVFTNYAHFDNPALDSLITQAMATTDTAKRVQLSQQAQQLVISQAPMAFLFTQNVLIGTQKNVTGITQTDDQFLRLADLRFR